MNFRILTLKYMGWCPGVESAAKFIPDRDIPPTRIVFAALLIGSVSASSFLLSRETMVYLGFPSDPPVRYSNGNPKIVSFDGQLYLFLEVESESGRDYDVPDFHSSSLYSAKLDLDGSLSKVKKILDLGDVSASYNVLVTYDHRCLLVYRYKELVNPERYESSSVFFTQSTDFQEWDTPIIMGEETPGLRLLEKADGEILLVGRNAYTVFDESKGIGDVYPIPLAQTPDISELGGDIHCFLDKDQRFSVIGVIRILQPHQEIEVEGLILSRLEGDDWTEPEYLTRMGMNIRGEYPKIQYISALDRYLLLVRDPDPRIYAYTLYMSTDLKTWQSPTPITYSDDDVNTKTTAKNPKIVELQNGTLALVFKGTISDYSDYPDLETVSTSFFLSMSNDGKNGGSPRPIDKIIDENAVEKSRGVMRGNVSTFISAAATILIIGLLYKNPSIILGR